MRCPKCQAVNLADSLFCEECSAALEAACLSCGASNRPVAKFCRKCSAPLTGSRAETGVRPQPPASWHEYWHHTCVAGDASQLAGQVVELKAEESWRADSNRGPADYEPEKDK